MTVPDCLVPDQLATSFEELFGVLNPLLAAFIHVPSELTFILNSTRLLPPPERRPHPGPVALARQSA